MAAIAEAWLEPQGAAMRMFARAVAISMLLGSAALLALVVVDHVELGEAPRRKAVDGMRVRGAWLLGIPGAFMTLGGYALIKRFERAAVLAATFAFATAAFFRLAQQAARGG